WSVRVGLGRGGGGSGASLVLLATVAWVLLANVLRVVLITYLSVRSDVDLTSGWRHEALGLGMFGAVLGLIWSTDRAFAFFAAPVHPQFPRTVSSGMASSELPNPRNSEESSVGASALSVGLIWTVLITFGGVSVLQLYSSKALVDTGAPSAALSPLAFDALSESALPAELVGWQRNGFTMQRRNPGSAFGE